MLMPALTQIQVFSLACAMHYRRIAFGSFVLKMHPENVAVYVPIDSDRYLKVIFHNF